ncbi:tRNA dihydrouridine synthase [Desulfovibrio ferrophilus]|uniref:tRNA-dihydrouridine synthase n=1 Tax=Desulfovibrio ferrophilus TaxID=241368 RepID=A0A2Z6AXL6_9BACT|nr:tRNA-dihydrouridine synthase family protein [Desulfovibrio ferrophilus]BBD07981.1 dihydrouridine synthase DuS [Desulfovibrio ferrophilus]
MNSTSTLSIAPDAPWLAPLAGYSDLSFRLLCRENGCRVAVTEMVSAKGLCYDSRGTSELLKTTPEDSPLVVQLFGSEIEFIERAMHTLMEQGVRYFDLNAGCPVRKVIKTGCGASLHTNVGLLESIAERMAKIAGPGNCGVKFRRGWVAGEDNYLDIGKRLQDAGTAWVALHPRTAKQGYAGEADWSCLKELSNTIDIPVIASGDLITAEDGVRCIRETGVQGVMFARGALYGPTIFNDYLTLLRGEVLPPRTGQDLAKVILRHAELSREHLPERKALLKMRSIVPRYVRHNPGVRKLRTQLINCDSWEELESMVLDFLEANHSAA